MDSSHRQLGRHVSLNVRVTSCMDIESLPLYQDSFKLLQGFQQRRENKETSTPTYKYGHSQVALPTSAVHILPRARITLLRPNMDNFPRLISWGTKTAKHIVKPLTFFTVANLAEGLATNLPVCQSIPWLTITMELLKYHMCSNEDLWRWQQARCKQQRRPISLKR